MTHYLIDCCTDCGCKCGFPTGYFEIALSSTSDPTDKLNLNLRFDDQTGSIIGRASWTDYEGKVNGFHDCEHAYFKVDGCSKRLELTMDPPFFNGDFVNSLDTEGQSPLNGVFANQLLEHQPPLPSGGQAPARCVMPQKWVCNVSGSGCPAISKMSATCTYSGSEKTKVYHGKMRFVHY